MGDLLGMPEWLAIVVWTVIVLATVLAYGNYSIRKTHKLLAKRRPNPTREQFIKLLAPDVDGDVASWAIIPLRQVSLDSVGSRDSEGT